MSHISSGDPNRPVQALVQFRLVHLIYLVTLFGSSLAAFGPHGIWLAALASVFWIAVFISPSRPAAFRSGSLVVLAGVCTVCCFLPAVRTTRTPARRMQCLNNLKQIALALHNYHDSFGTFPPAFVANQHGEPWHSWRVLILPFMDHQRLYETYDFDEPWNGPNNSKLLDQMPSVYACPTVQRAAGGRTTNVSYLAVVGPNTSWPGSSARRLGDFTDGTENTLLVVEYPEQQVSWLEPRDLDFDQSLVLLTSPQPAGARSHPPTGRSAVFADGSVRSIGNGVASKVWAAVLSVNDGVDWTKADLKGSPPVEQTAWLRNGLRFGGFVAVLLLPVGWVFRTDPR